MNEVVVKEKASLDELMLAMDVVDTLRHKELVLARVLSQYELHIVSRPGELSGLPPRISDANPSVQNLYLLVEAVAPNGAKLTLPIKSEETQRTKRVDQWGLRVDEATYNRVRADKQDDGIIQNDLVGRKRRGVLEREYTIQTTGGAITEW